MKSRMACIFMFAMGAAVGSAVSWRILKQKYEQIAREEIASVKKRYSTKNTLNEGKDEPEIDEEIVEQTVEEHTSLDGYSRLVTDLGYKNYSNSEEKKEEVKPVKDDAPRVIIPEEFGEEPGYDTASYTYYEDGVLTDENDDVVEDLDSVVGADFATHFGEYEDDSVFIRNDRLKCDYEILKDQRNYSDVVGVTGPPHYAED